MSYQIHCRSGSLTSSEGIAAIDVLGERPLSTKLLTGVDDKVVQRESKARHTNVHWTVAVIGRVYLTCGIMAIGRRDERICLLHQREPADISADLRASHLEIVWSDVRPRPTGVTGDGRPMIPQIASADVPGQKV